MTEFQKTSTETERRARVWGGSKAVTNCPACS